MVIAAFPQQSSIILGKFSNFSNFSNCRAVCISVVRSPQSFITPKNTAFSERTEPTNNLNTNEYNSASYSVNKWTLGRRSSKHRGTTQMTKHNQAIDIFSMIKPLVNHLY